MDGVVELTTLSATRYGGNWAAYRDLKAQELAAARRTLADAEKQVADAARGAQGAVERQARRNGAGRRKGLGGGTPRIVLGLMKDRDEDTTDGNARRAEKLREQAAEAAAVAREKVEVLQPLTVKLPPTYLPAGKLVLRTDEVTVGYEPGRPVIHGLSFEVTGPERVAVTGQNGSGKTTLLSLLTGRITPWSGTAEVVTSFSLLDQEVSVLDPSVSVRDNFRWLNPGTDEQTCRAALAKCLFRADAALQGVGMLSGGERLRAGLICVLGAAPPPLLILDEPTNHLDVDSIEAVEAGLRAYDGALVVVSHDKTFLQAFGITRRVELYPPPRPPRRREVTQDSRPRLPMLPGLCPEARGAGWMTPFERPDRCCPKCEHKGYMFRARRTVDGKPDEGGGKFAETKYRCRSCSHEWWERIPAPPDPKRKEAA